MTISHLGHISILAALSIAALQFFLPLYGYIRKKPYLLKTAKPLTFIQAFLVLNAFLLLILAFLINDFSIAYVNQNSHPDLPYYYRITAVWGAHEGSFLLWIFILNLWSILLAVCCKHQAVVRDVTLSLMGLVSFCFLCFLDWTSDPFMRNASIAPQDLNPLLQDPGFLIHPPMLYAGYVGFSTVFCLTLAFLIVNPKDCIKIWAKTTRSWVLGAWSFLTIGIVLGSWWAYRVLGWGGFWFWDPVENASLLPWLCGTALLHMMVVVEKKGRFFDWACILAIFTFSLSILGTFLVRSGVLISVHSFASDPFRGLFLLLILMFVTTLALLLYFFRRPNRESERASKNEPLSSREGILLVQSIFLFTGMATVLLGTLYPLIGNLLGDPISIGAPYFNQVLYPVLLLMLPLMAAAPQTQWVALKKKLFLRKMLKDFFVSVSLAIVLILFFTWRWDTLLILWLTLLLWVMLSVRTLFFTQLPMMLSHLGFAIVMLAILLTTSFSQESEIRLKTGEEAKMGPYTLHFFETTGVQGSNYRGIQAQFELLYHQKHIAFLKPQKRIYPVRDMVMSKVDIYPAIFHDFYIALGEPLSENEWTLRIYYKPFIRWMWLGGLCIALGGFFSILTRKKT